MSSSSSIGACLRVERVDGRSSADLFCRYIRQPFLRLLHRCIDACGHNLQREEMRARFPGVPGDLVNYFSYVAEEVNSWLTKQDPHITTEVQHTSVFLLCCSVLLNRYFELPIFAQKSSQKCKSKQLFLSGPRDIGRIGL